MNNRHYDNKAAESELGEQYMSYESAIHTQVRDLEKSVAVRSRADRLFQYRLNTRLSLI